MKLGTHLLSLLALGPLLVMADTPANCTFEDVEGSWMFYETDRDNDNSLDCEVSKAVVSKTRVELKYPDVAVDQFGNIGTWTMIYNQVSSILSSSSPKLKSTKLAVDAKKYGSTRSL